MANRVMQQPAIWILLVSLTLTQASVAIGETSTFYGEDSLERTHWAFQRPQKVPLPAVEYSDWPQREFDFLVLHQLEAHGLEPSPRASRQTLIRRLYFDLLGLPPTFEQVQQFLNDASPNAYQDLVDSLLQSEHFGER